jgi:sugar lactone lactonase YvrE
MSAAQPDILMTGLAFGESPRWHDGRLWLADWGSQEIIAIGGDGRRETNVQLNFGPFQPICFDWLQDGRLVLVSSQDARLLRREANGALVPYADLSAISRGWNEIVVDGRGNAYVNGGGFDLMAGAPFAPGFVVLITGDGRVHQVADGLAFPNGMAVTPDNRRRVVRQETHGVRDRGRRHAVESTRLGRARQRRARRHLHRRGRRRLVRGCSQQVLRTGP